MGSVRIKVRLARTTRMLRIAVITRKRRAKRSTGVYTFCSSVSPLGVPGSPVMSPWRRNHDPNTGTAVSATRVEASRDTQTVWAKGAKN